MKKAIAIVAFITIALISVSAMAQDPVGPRNITATTTPEGGYNVTRMGRDLLPGWLILIYNPDTRRHDVAVVNEPMDMECEEDTEEVVEIEECDDSMYMTLINDGSVIYIMDTSRYLVAAADSVVRVIQP